MENHDISQKTMKAVDSIRLSKFLESASQALITLLEEDEERRYGSSKEAQEQKDVVFSDRVTLLGKQCIVNDTNIHTLEEIKDYTISLFMK